jgi:hypothetical protein
VGESVTLAAREGDVELERHRPRQGAQGETIALN